MYTKNQFWFIFVGHCDFTHLFYLIFCWNLFYFYWHQHSISKSFYEFLLLFGCIKSSHKLSIFMTIDPELLYVHFQYCDLRPNAFYWTNSSKPKTVYCLQLLTVRTLSAQYITVAVNLPVANKRIIVYM